MRGAFILPGDIEIPNQLTDLGMQEVLGRAMRNVVGFTNMHAALVNGIWTPDLRIQDLDEPAIGTGGYGRQPLNRDSVDWPTMGETAGIPYIESKPIIYSPTGNFSKAVSRIALVDSLNGVAGSVFALSALFPDNLQITAATPVSGRTFKYRLYGR